MHIIKDENRGPTLEVVVSRMKTVQSLSRALKNASPVPMRFVAVSATIPNTEDVSHNLHLLDFLLFMDCLINLISEKKAFSISHLINLVYVES